MPHRSLCQQPAVGELIHAEAHHAMTTSRPSIAAYSKLLLNEPADQPFLDSGDLRMHEGDRPDAARDVPPAMFSRQ